jgi:hypothetical protein
LSLGALPSEENELHRSSSSIILRRRSYLAVARLAGFILTLGGAASHASAAGGSQLELGGVQVGMTIEQVRSELGKRKLQVTADEAKFSPSQPSFVTRLRGGSAGQNPATDPVESITVQFATPPNEPRAISVMRLATYPSNKGPEVESVSRAFTERFGKPVRNPSTKFTSTPLWLWGPVGPIAPDPGNTCEAYLRNFDYQGGMSLGAFTQEISPEKFSRALKAGCSTGAYATLQSDPTGIRLLRLTSVVVDFGAADKAIRATSAHMSKLKGEAADRDRDAAKRIKPNI